MPLLIVCKQVERSKAGLDEGCPSSAERGPISGQISEGRLRCQTCWERFFASTDPSPDYMSDRVLAPPESMVVYGRARQKLGTATSASEGRVAGADLELRPMGRVGELLEVVPGLIATQHSGQGKSNQLFLRGFNLDHGTDFAAHLDGVPRNFRTHGHGQGYLDLNFLIPEIVESIDFRKGPYRADVGDFSSAGSSFMRTVDRLPELPAIGVRELGVGQYVRIEDGGQLTEKQLREAIFSDPESSMKALYAEMSYGAFELSEAFIVSMGPAEIYPPEGACHPGQSNILIDVDEALEPNPDWFSVDHFLGVIHPDGACNFNVGFSGHESVWIVEDPNNVYDVTLNGGASYFDGIYMPLARSTAKPRYIESSETNSFGNPVFLDPSDSSTRIYLCELDGVGDAVSDMGLIGSDPSSTRCEVISETDTLRCIKRTDDRRRSSSRGSRRANSARTRHRRSPPAWRGPRAPTPYSLEAHPDPMRR
jgi:hypothetical protein